MSNASAPPISATATLEQMELLAMFKEHMTRGRESNVSPFSDDGIIRYQTQIEELDVPEIHGEVRELIGKSIEGIHQGRQSQVVILVGDPGAGKSHLINYFRLPSVAEKLGYVLVCNSNSWRVEEFEECLLDWLIDGLTRQTPTKPDLLLEKVRDIAFQALRDLLATPGRIREVLPHRRRRWLAALWNRLLNRSEHTRFQQAVQDRKDAIFRKVDFHRFARYACDRFLAESGNRFHRYLMHVLLRYLFVEDREAVLHWLRGKEVDDYFFRKLGVREKIDRHYKVFDALKILVSLFTPEVAKGIRDGNEPGKSRGTTFFLAFDQIEGREELFESENDWFKFFAQLSELYNGLPNVFILFTMTVRLRQELHPKMERQFRDRIRHDHRFVLKEVSEPERLQFYRHRLRTWLRPQPEMLEMLERLGNPFLPFDQVEVLKSSQGKTLRQVLSNWDELFRRYLEELAIDIPLDYEVALKEIRLAEKTMKEHEYVKNHLVTVCTLLNLLGDSLAKLQGVVLDGMAAAKTKQNVKALELRFSDPNNRPRWIRLYLVLLPFRFNEKARSSVGLLDNKARNRNQLWFARHQDFKLAPDLLGNHQDQVFQDVIKPEQESSLQAVIRVWERKDKYLSEVWQKGELFLLQKLRSTYLGELFESAREMLQLSAPDDEPVGDEMFTPVNAQDLVGADE